MKHSPDSSDLNQAIKDYHIPAKHDKDGVIVPLSPVVIVDPSSDPARLVPQGWWLYQARRVCTQNNGGGGDLRVRISMNPGQVGRLIRSEALGSASAGSALTIILADEDAAGTQYLATIPAGASRQAYLPSIGTAATANLNLCNSTGMMIGPGEYLIYRSSVNLQTETLTVGIVLLLSTPDVPIWDTTGSAGTPALAASTISPANTMQKIDLPW